MDWKKFFFEEVKKRGWPHTSCVAWEGGSLEALQELKKIPREVAVELIPDGHVIYEEEHYVKAKRGDEEGYFSVSEQWYRCEGGIVQVAQYLQVDATSPLRMYSLSCRLLGDHAFQLFLENTEGDGVAELDIKGPFDTRKLLDDAFEAYSRFISREP